MKEQIDLIKNFNLTTSTEKDVELFLPTLGMNDEKLSEMPAELSSYFGKGVKFWQYPNQFSKLLKKINTLNINSYVEIGVRWGGSFIVTSEFLKKNNPSCSFHACDIIPESELLQEYRKHTDFTYYQENSHDQTFLNKLPGTVDLVFIDGNHSYNAVKQDFENFKNRAKYIIFHDVLSVACPGTTQFWNEIKNGYEHYEYVDQYSSVGANYLGIGLIVNNINL